MRSWARNLKLFALLSALATPAAATPPQVVMVEDTLFARTQSTLIMLREITDNHGLHTVLQTDTVVVLKSLDRGRDYQLMVAARVVDFGIDSEPPRVVNRGPQVPYNPYDVHDEYDAWPLRYSLRGPAQTVAFTADGIQINAPDYPSAKSYSTSLDSISAIVTESLRNTRAMAPLDRVGGGTVGPDSFDPTRFDVLRDCTISGTMLLFDFADDPALAQITCRDEDETQVAVLWLVVPADAQ